MRGVPVLLFLVSTTTAAAQTLAPKPSAIQHITVAPFTSAESVPPGGTVTLWADVTPNANIHVYASDRNGTTPVTLVLTPHAGVAAGKLKLPSPELLPTVGADAPVPVYRKLFRMERPVTLGQPLASGDRVTIAGVVNYQACDDRVCYPTLSVPVTWVVTVR